MPPRQRFAGSREQEIAVLMRLKEAGLLRQRSGAYAGNPTAIHRIGGAYSTRQFHKDEALGRQTVKTAAKTLAVGVGSYLAYRMARKYGMSAFSKAGATIAPKWRGMAHGMNKAGHKLFNVRPFTVVSGPAARNPFMGNLPHGAVGPQHGTFTSTLIRDLSTGRIVKNPRTYPSKNIFNMYNPYPKGRLHNLPGSHVPYGTRPYPFRTSSMVDAAKAARKATAKRGIRALHKIKKKIKGL